MKRTLSTGTTFKTGRKLAFSGTLILLMSLLTSTFPHANGEVLGDSAQLVIGQPYFPLNICRGDFTAQISEPTFLCAPEGVAFDSFGNLWVTDWTNNRVLMFLNEQD